MFVGANESSAQQQCSCTDKYIFPTPLRYKCISSVIDHRVYRDSSELPGARFRLESKKEARIQRNVHFNASVINAELFHVRAQPYQSRILSSLVHWSATSGAQCGVIKAIKKKSKRDYSYFWCRCNFSLLALFHQTVTCGGFVFFFKIPISKR